MRHPIVPKQGTTGRDEIRLVIADDHRLFLMGLRQFLGKQPGIRIVGEAVTGLAADRKSVV